MYILYSHWLTRNSIRYHTHHRLTEINICSRTSENFDLVRIEERCFSKYGRLCWGKSILDRRFCRCLHNGYPLDVCVFWILGKIARSVFCILGRYVNMSKNRAHCDDMIRTTWLRLRNHISRDLFGKWVWRREISTGWPLFWKTWKSGNRGIWMRKNQGILKNIVKVKR